jgi:WD40 repeat protein
MPAAARSNGPCADTRGIVGGVSYSNDGRWLATAGSDGTVRVWPARGGEAVILVGHQDAVNMAEFNDSGDRIVSAGGDGKILIWDAAGGDALVELYQHRGIASGTDFGDGRDVRSPSVSEQRSTMASAGILRNTLNSRSM